MMGSLKQGSWSKTTWAKDISKITKSSKMTKAKRAWDMDYMVEYLPRKCKAFSSNLNAAPPKKRKC
jgi:hypothetical protein